MAATGPIGAGAKWRIRRGPATTGVAEEPSDGAAELAVSRRRDISILSSREAPSRAALAKEPAPMNQTNDEIDLLLLPLVLLAAAVVSVPMRGSCGLSPIVAYLAAGVVIGPFGVALFAEPQPS